MTLENYLSLAAYLGALFLLTPFLGNYMANALVGKRVLISSLLLPIERLIYRTCFIDPTIEMSWKKYASSVLWLSFFGLVTLFLLQTTQQLLPLNPQNLPAVPWDLAFNTAVSFVTNTNWQAYSGETTLSYLVQTLGLTVQNFISAAVGLAVLLAFIRGLIRKNTTTIGNFWVDVVRSILYVLMPLSLILAIVLNNQGVVQNFSSYVTATTLEGAEQVLPMGPAASQIAIKQLGSNGGGFFGVNSAHPFENPTPLSNFLQMLAILLIPSSLVYMFGLLAHQRKHAFMIYMVMLAIFLLALFASLWSEHLFNPSLQSSSALEGKELRFGITDSILWSSATTASSNGSVNAMHDSLSPIAGGLALLQILLGEVIFGGVGSGLYGMLLFVLLTVFLAGLMVGRTPEYLGKKIEAFDIQMSVLAIVLPSAVVLIGAGISSVLPIPLKSLANSGPHGLSEIIYAWGSAANNNGSAFAGLSVNTNFYNIGLGIAMLLGRFGIIVPVLAIAGNLANKKLISPSAATFATDTPVFAVLLACIVVIIGALTFFPTLALGPLSEHLLMLAGRSF
jgi:potassium-transporting ATPase potassium-binding subunit